MLNREEVARIALENGFTGKGSTNPGGLHEYVFDFAAALIEEFGETVVEKARGTPWLLDAVVQTIDTSVLQTVTQLKGNGNV